MAISLLVFGVLELATALVVRSLRPPTATNPAAPPVSFPGPLPVGAASQIIDIPPGHSLGGFGLFRPSARGSAGPLKARALVIGKLAIVSVDLLEIPPSLEAAVNSRMASAGLSVWLCATHTHSGPGGYDPARLPQWFGARAFEPTIFGAVVDAAVAATLAASWNTRPARLRWAHERHPELKTDRSSSARTSKELWVLQAQDDEGQTIATLVDFGAHATLIPRRAALLSPDWPGAAAEALERTAGGVGLVVQGIGGDSSARTDDLPVAGSPWERASLYGELVAKTALGMLASETARPVATEMLAEQKATLTWDVAAILHVPLPGTTEPVETTLRAASLGGLEVLCLPGEITGSAWRELGSDASLKDVLPLTLCGDELSYVESRDLIAEGKGERLVLYPDALPQLGEALRGLAGALLPRGSAPGTP